MASRLALGLAAPLCRAVCTLGAPVGAWGALASTSAPAAATAGARGIASLGGAASGDGWAPSGEACGLVSGWGVCGLVAGAEACGGLAASWESRRWMAVPKKKSSLMRRGNRSAHKHIRRAETVFQCVGCGHYSAVKQFACPVCHGKKAAKAARLAAAVEAAGGGES